MNKRILIPGALAASLLIPSIGGAQRDRQRDDDRNGDRGPWIHVEVLEEGAEGAKVNVNLPLSMARIALEMAPEEVFDDGRIEINDRDITIEDLRNAWKELREAGDAEFVTIAEDDETVKIYRRGDTIFVDVDGEDDEIVRIEVPVDVVDALLGGRGNELDLDAALAALERMSGSTVVRVQDGNESVRVWID